MVDSNKKDFVWKFTRISFYVYIILSVITLITLILTISAGDSEVGIIIYLVLFWLVFITLVSNLISSIVHLTKHKEKGFAITSLGVSSILLLLGLIFLILGTFSNEYNNQITYRDYDGFNEYGAYKIEEYVDKSCQDFCTGVENVESYDYEYDNSSRKVVCYCFGISKDIVIQKNIPSPN